MSFQQERTWQNLDLLYDSSVAQQIARYACGVSFDALPPDVVHHARRNLLDGLGCAIGGFKAPGRIACQNTALALGGPSEATIFGSGLRTGASSATLVNCFMMRFLEYNDVGGGNHNEEAIPALFAISESLGRRGSEFLTALVVSYEIGARVILAATAGAATYDKYGWSTDARGGLNMPPAIARLMGLTPGQTAHAIAICAGRGVPLGILDADKEENSMAKNLRFGAITRDAIVACHLAKNGLTGPLRVVEGDGGYAQGILGGEIDLAKLTDFSAWHIRDTRHKTLCANGSTQGHVLATIGIVSDEGLMPADIDKVMIRASAREARHTTALAKKYPRDAETADHSAYYANAYAIKFRGFGPDSADPRHFTDPEIVDLIERVTIEASPDLPPRSRAGISEIHTKDGRVFSRQCDALTRELSDAELEAKFRDMAEGAMPRSQVEGLIEAIWNVDRAPTLERLASLMIFPNGHP
jgi:2-methylcitrate dehydratase